MLAKRWLWISFALLVVWSGNARAQVSMTPPTLDAGNILLGQSNSANGQLASVQNITVDVVLTTTCTGTGMGMFELTSSSGSLTGINLNSPKTITAAYTPMTRGLRECDVNVFDTSGSTMPVLTFKVRGTGIAPIIGTTPATSHTFATVRANNAAPTHSTSVNVVVSNNGDAGTTLTVTSLSFVGGLPMDYAYSGPALPASIVPGSPATFVVTFDPQAAVASSTTLQIATDDPVTPTKNISLMGTGSTGVISVTDVAFGLTTINTSPTGFSISVSNIGAPTKGPLGVTQATMMGNTASWFRFTGGGCAGSTTTCALALSITNTAATVPVTCTPPAGTTAGTMQSAMVVFTSDTDSATDSISMLTCTAGRADLAVDTTPLAFGDQLVNTASTGKTVMLTNNGNQTLQYSLSFTDATHFLVTGVAGCTTNCPLGAGASANVTVQFRPTSVGMKTSALRVTALNDPDTTFLDVPLSGTGVAPVSTPSALALSFGNIDVGDTSTAQTLTVTNNGTYPLTINAAYLFGGAADYLTTGTTGTSISITLQPTQSTAWTIACKPSVMGSRPGTFRITSNHNGAPNTSQDIALSCTGLQGLLAFVPGTLYDFGGVRENETRMQTFVLRNNGNTPVNNITVAFTGTGTGYTFAPTTIASIAPLAQVNVTVTFAPLDGTYGGVYTGTYTGTWGNAKTTMASQSVNGDGLTTGYDTSPSNPNALEFGDVRFDQTKIMNVSVINTAGTGLQIRGVTITPGTAQTGEFTLLRCLKNSIQILCPTAAAPYNSSGINDTIVLQILFDPNNRVAMMDATLTVASDLPTNPNRTVLMRGSSITAAITLNPTTMVLDFGPTDLDVMPVSVTRTVTLTNSGAAPLDFQSVTKVGGPLGNTRFSFSTTTAPFTLQPNASYSIQVTYTPIVERPSNQPDTGSITFGMVAGVFGGPTAVTIQLTGYGVDRHISLAPAPTFPETFVNPEEPPVRPVSVTNNGDADLRMLMTMLTNGPVWQLQNPIESAQQEVVIPGRGTYDFLVEFRPEIEGKAPTGRLTLTNTDNQMMMVSVDLDGLGKRRNATISDTTVDFGFVGIGMTARLSTLKKGDFLSVTNLDPEPWTLDDFTVHEGDGAFAVVLPDGSAPGEVLLGMNEAHELDIEFTPPYAGEFNGFINLPGTNPITVKGTGLYVETGGGGGCSTGRGGGSAMALVLLALVLGRRRRGLVAALAIVGFGATTARAQTASVPEADNRNVSISVFDPTPTAKLDATFQLQGPEVADKGAFGMSAVVAYASQPLLMQTSQNDTLAVKQRTTMLVGAAYSFGDFELGLRIPLFVQSGDPALTPEQHQQMYGVDPAGHALGDLTAHGKYQIGARDRVAYGIAGAITAPTAMKDQFAGNELPTVRALFLLQLAKGPIAATLNAGGVLRQKAQLGSAVQASGAAFGAGLSWRVLDKMWLAGEIFGDLIPGGQTDMATGRADKLGKPIEWLAGLRYRMSRTADLGLALGRGVTGDIGSPALRGVLSLSIAPSTTELKPLRPPRPPEPEKDADGDSIKDELDTCPSEPEDKDLFDDADGCPDNDNDADGLSDTADKCPLDAEDHDKFKDDDGCPDKDNDGDGVPDEKDKCQLVAEDKDNVSDQDGCPDPDNDGDGLLDNVDKCPKEPETINGNNDDDGCPDKGNAVVVLSPDRLETLESVQFNGAKVSRSSHNVLAQVGATLRAHPEILRVRLTVHVQPTNNASADRKLSEQRAKAMRDWLVEWGVDPLRLQASGFGGTKPLVPASSRGAQQINDRVELIILERK